jgi:hypothetical protein
MAYLTLSEYSELAYSNKTQHAGQVGGVPLAEQSISMSGSSTTCSALNVQTRLVEICADTACYLAFGTAPTAVANYHYLPAGQQRLYAICAPTLLACIT